MESVYAAVPFYFRTMHLRILRHPFKIAIVVLSFASVVPCLAQSVDTSSLSLKKQLIIAETKYYESLATKKSISDLLVTSIPSIVGTLVGAALALFGVHWSSNKQWKLEKDRWEKTLSNEAIKEVRLAAAELAKTIGAEIQTIIWITWIGKYDTSRLSEKDIDEYDRQIKKLFKDDVVAQAYLAVLDPDLYKEFKDLIKQVWNIDHRMAFKIQNFKTSNDVLKTKAAMELGMFYEEASGLYDKIPDILGNMLPAIK